MFFDNEYLREAKIEAKIGTAQNVVKGTYASSAEYKKQSLFI
jgi:hypothetical protein